VALSLIPEGIKEVSIATPTRVRGLVEKQCDKQLGRERPTPRKGVISARELAERIVADQLRYLAKIVTETRGLACPLHISRLLCQSYRVLRDY